MDIYRVFLTNEKNFFHQLKSRFKNLIFNGVDIRSVYLFYVKFTVI